MYATNINKDVIILKKLLPILSASTFILCLFFSPCNASNNYCDEYYQSLQMLLYPSIISEVKEVYDEFASIDIFDIYINDIKRTQNNFTINATIKPFKGAHNTISEDHIVLIITPRGIQLSEWENQKPGQNRQ